MADLPPGHRRWRLEDGRDRQDRRPLLLLQAYPEVARRAAFLGPDDRHRGRADQCRAGRLRRRRDGSSRPPRRARRPNVPPDGSQSDARRRHAGRPRKSGARARLHGQGQRKPVRPRAASVDARPDGADPDPPHAKDDDEGARPAGRHLHVRQLSHPLRQPRDAQAPASGRHHSPAVRGLRLAALGLLGAPSRSGPVCRPFSARRGRGQARPGDGRLGRHRQGDRAQARPSRREDADRGARPGKARSRRARNSRPRASRSRPTAPTFPTRRNARRSSSGS